jgi:hypothetical protein
LPGTDADSSGAPGARAAEPGERDDQVDGRNALGQIGRGRGTDQHDSRCREAGAQGAKEGSRLQSFRHTAVDDDRDIHSRTV